MSDVKIVNFGGVEVLGRVSVNHAIKMVYSGKAKIVESVPERFIGPYPLPKIIELVKFIYARWKYNGNVPYSKRGVLRRDKYRCAYCDGHAGTMDHVKPRSKGGLAEWSNAVAACFKCNNKKGNRTPEEAGMKLLRKPFEPLRGDLVY